MKKQKNIYSCSNTRGITLVALVITIIVLLILAGVAIRAVVGDNGVLSQATKSSDKSKYKAETELAEMQIEYITEGENIGKIDIQKTIDNINALDEVEEAIMDSGTIVVSFKDGKTYDIVIPKANITNDDTETNEFELILIANADPDGTNTTSQEEMNFYNNLLLTGIHGTK